MKKILTLLTILILTTSLSADKTKRAKLSSDMRSMLSAMELIQKGGFYSKPEMMQAGVAKLKKGLHSLTTTDAKSYLPEDKANADKFANKRARMINMYADDLLVSLQNQDMDEALVDYTQILKQCTSCHLRIRPY
jgi:cytochrome c556